MVKLSRQALMRQLEQVNDEYKLLQKALTHWADHSCLTDPRVVELVEAAEAALEGAPCWSRRLRTALAAFKGEK